MKKTHFYLLGLLGAFSLFAQPALAAPANDNFANAEIIVGDTPTTPGSNVGATLESGETAPLPGYEPYFDKSIWYQWTPPFGNKAHLDTIGSNFDTIIGVFTGSSVNALTRIAGNDDVSVGVPHSVVEFDIVPGTTYYIQVSGYSSSSGTVLLNLERVFSIGGRVTNASNVGVQGVEIKLSQLGTGNNYYVQTDVNGYYKVDQLKSDSFTVTPTATNLSFTPVSRAFEANGPLTNVNFVATTNVKPSLTITNTTVTEGDSGSTAPGFEVKLSAPSALPVTVTYATSNDTAVAPNDYNAASNTLTFSPGETYKKLYIFVKGDTIDEIDERYNVNLTNPVNATINDNLGVGFITDDDAPPVLSIDSPSISEGNAGTKVLNFKVKLSVASSKTVTVSAKTTPAASTATTDPATAAVDYVALPATAITFAPGELTKTIGVTVNADVIDELNETFNVVLSAPGNATIGVNTGVGTINDDDATPSLSINDVTVTEGDSGTLNAAFTVTLSAASGRTVKVFVATQDGTAFNGFDYIGLDDLTVTLLPSQTSKVVNIPIKGDLIDEPTETYQVKLSYPENAGIADSLGIGTILDNDNAPTISMAPVSVTEGNSGSTVTMQFLAKLSNPSSKTVSYKVQTSPAAVDPATPNTDFVPISLTTVDIPAGTTQQLFFVTVKGDDSDEVNEKIGLTLSAPTNATLITTNVEGTIIDDDSAPYFNIENITLEEGNSGNTIVNFPITLSQPSGKTVSIKFKTGNSATTPATAGVDYIAVPETVITFAPGQTFKNAPVSVVGDLFFEDNEVFLGLFSSPVNGTIEGSSRTALIYNDDEAPELFINSTTLTEGNSGTKTATLTVKLSKAANTNVTVKFTTVNATASAGEDYVAQNGTLTFTPGQLSKTITVTVKGDTLYEGEAELFYVDLSESVGADLGEFYSGMVTITDDDPNTGRSGGSS